MNAGTAGSNPALSVYLLSPLLTRKLFFEIHSGPPREGAILDIGCGPDMQTLEISLYRRFSEWYGYVFYVMKVPASG